MTLDLTELRALLERATPGPYRAHDHMDMQRLGEDPEKWMGYAWVGRITPHSEPDGRFDAGWLDRDSRKDACHEYRERAAADVKFVAAALNALPELLALAEAGMAAGWRDMASAPKDGKPIIAWVRHPNWRLASDDDKARWEGPVIAHWIDHNGGGWVWHGHLGTFLGWMPASDLPLPAPPEEPDHA